MNPSITTLERPASLLQSSPVLTQDGFTCTLLTLQPGAETVLSVSRPDHRQLLFVTEGEIAIRTDEVTTMINRDGASLLPAGAAPTASNPGTDPARVLRVEIPGRQVVTPQIITPRS